MLVFSQYVHMHVQTLIVFRLRQKNCPKCHVYTIIRWWLTLCNRGSIVIIDVSKLCILPLIEQSNSYIHLTCIFAINAVQTETQVLCPC